MSTPDSFHDALDRLEAGDEDAAAEVFHRFASRLIRLAGTRLNTRVRRQVDPEDVVQSVFRSFFDRQAAGQFELENWNSLWSLLVRIVVRKCGRRAAALQAERRDVRREVASEDISDCSQAMAREPTAEEIVSLTEMLERLMSSLSDSQQQIVGMRLEGYKVQEISGEVGCTERTVHRVLARVREGLARLESDS